MTAIKAMIDECRISRRVITFLLHSLYLGRSPLPPGTGMLVAALAPVLATCTWARRHASRRARLVPRAVRTRGVPRWQSGVALL